MMQAKLFAKKEKKKKSIFISPAVKKQKNRALLTDVLTTKSLVHTEVRLFQPAATRGKTAIKHSHIFFIKVEKINQ